MTAFLNTDRPESELIKVDKQQLEMLVLQNRELKQTTQATTDLILLFIDMIGGKIPTSVTGGIMVLTKLPGIINGLTDEKKEHLQTVLNIIINNAPKYLTAHQQQRLIDTQVLTLIEKRDNNEI
ncbi:MAG: hypothetical protein IPM95_06945 [Sphingobacteriales bacterium]|nr:hypothetical protein [Sphingobacteriales bacterium]